LLTEGVGNQGMNELIYEAPLTAER